MPFEQIEKKKRDYTDKYVVVDATQPELARFRDIVGRVRTVNMSGRALVEFLDYHLNIGWYDIDPQFLKVVDKPPPKVEKPQAKKPAATAKAKPAAAAATKPQAAKAPSAAAKPGKPSVADILAAARAGKAGGAAPAGEVAAATGQLTAKPAPAAAPKPPAAAKPAAVDRSKMSVADMIAAASAGGAGGAAAAKPKSAAPVEAKTQADDAPVVDEPVVESVPAPAAKTVEKVDKSKMSIADIIAWCRQHDAK